MPYEGLSNLADVTYRGDFIKLGDGFIGAIEHPPATSRWCRTHANEGPDPRAKARQKMGSEETQPLWTCSRLIAGLLLDSITCAPKGESVYGTEDGRTKFRQDAWGVGVCGS